MLARDDQIGGAETVHNSFPFLPAPIGAEGNPSHLGYVFISGAMHAHRRFTRHCPARCRKEIRRLGLRSENDLVRHLREQRDAARFRIGRLG